MKWIADSIENSPPSIIGKLLSISSEYKDVISLAIGEPDLDTPEHIIKAGIDALKTKYTHYTSNFGFLELREAIAEKLDKENDFKVDPKNEIIVTCGAGVAIDLFMRTVLNPGDEVIVQDPGYFNYIYVSAFLDAKVVPLHV
ncbi:MAG TPA: aminotransferase class I/II-fold pyridoxal phosphate-dependent enzyme, partial [Methanomicrobia archaeon]|nr:aminotransferase class I/II-fold pyridoxal phosphate-dependent enzyme [Methanomicrobia archaeon]